MREEKGREEGRESEREAGGEGGKREKSAGRSSPASRGRPRRRPVRSAVRCSLPPSSTSLAGPVRRRRRRREPFEAWAGRRLGLAWPRRRGGRARRFLPSPPSLPTQAGRSGRAALQASTPAPPPPLEGGGLSEGPAAEGSWGGSRKLGGGSLLCPCVPALLFFLFLRSCLSLLLMFTCFLFVSSPTFCREWYRNVGCRGTK